MARISIEVTPDQQALRGQSIKEYVLEQTLPPEADNDQLSEEEALHALEAFLKPRIERAERGETIDRSVTDIFADARRKAAE